MEDAAIFLVRQIKMSLRQGQPPGPAGEPPHTGKTGKLAGTIDYEMGRLSAKIGTPLVYGRIHELGGVIRPKRAKALAFRTADGEFHMVKKVVMPKRPYLRPALDDRSNQKKIEWYIANG